MELLKTHQYYVLLNGEHSLWCDRKTGAFEAKPGKTPIIIEVSYQRNQGALVRSNMLPPNPPFPHFYQF